MVYNIIKIIAITGLKTFFRKISTQNNSIIPKKGPVIFVCNHPNLIIDAWLVGMTCNRRLYFLAKSEINNPSDHSKIGSIDPTFAQLLGFICIYLHANSHGNANIFGRVMAEHLAKLCSYHAKI